MSNKVYEKSTDLHVRGTYIYVKTGEVYAYADSAKSVKIDATTLQDLFLKGAIIVDGTVSYKPVSFGITSTVGIMTYVKTNSTTATVADLAVIKSSEYVAE